MSVDEFDPMIERLFSRAPEMNDSASFNARLEARLNKTTRVRTMALTSAGVVGGVFAIKEMLGIRLHLGASSMTAEAGTATANPVSLITSQGDSALSSWFAQLNLANMDYGSMVQMQVFWGVAGMLLALLTIGAVKLYQQV